MFQVRFLVPSRKKDPGSGTQNKKVMDQTKLKACPGGSKLWWQPRVEIPNIRKKIINVVLVKLLKYLNKNIIDEDSFWDISLSKLLSCFIVYLRQFKSESHIQGQFRKLENKTFHMTPRLMVFVA